MRGIAIIACSLWFFALLAGCASEPELDGRTVSDWIGLLRHQDWTVQEEAQDALARLGPKAMPYLKRALAVKDPTLRRGVVLTLGKIGPPAKSAVPMLLSIISRENVAIIRATILQALAKIDPRAPKVQEEFVKRLRDVDPEVRAAAQVGVDLGKQEPQAPSGQAEPAADGGQVPAAETKPAKAPEFELRAAVAEELARKQPQVAFGLIAEVVRADRRAAIFWPGLRQGKVVGDATMAFVFERKGEEPWRLIAQVDALQTADAAVKLSEALGGADGQRVVRPCGVARDELSGYLADNGRAFGEAKAAGDDQQAMAAYERLTRAFSFHLAAYDRKVIELLVGGVFSAPWTIQAGAAGERLGFQAQVAGKQVEGKLELRPCGGGVVIGKLEL